MTFSQNINVSDLWIKNLPNIDSGSATQDLIFWKFHQMHCFLHRVVLTRAFQRLGSLYQAIKPVAPIPVPPTHSEQAQRQAVRLDCELHAEQRQSSKARKPPGHRGNQRHETERREDKSHMDLEGSLVDYDRGSRNWRSRTNAKSTSMTDTTNII